MQEYFSTFPDVQTFLQMMMTQSDDDLRVAWKYLKRMPTPQNKSKRKWGLVWCKLDKARRSGQTEAPPVPTWLDQTWQQYHDEKREDARLQQAMAARLGVLPDAQACLQEMLLLPIHEFEAAQTYLR